MADFTTPGAEKTREANEKNAKQNQQLHQNIQRHTCATQQRFHKRRDLTAGSECQSSLIQVMSAASRDNGGEVTSLARTLYLGVFPSRLHGLLFLSKQSLIIIIECWRTFSWTECRDSETCPFAATPLPRTTPWDSSTPHHCAHTFLASHHDNNHTTTTTSHTTRKTVTQPSRIKSQEHKDNHTSPTHATPHNTKYYSTAQQGHTDEITTNTKMEMQIHTGTQIATDRCTRACVRVHMAAPRFFAGRRHGSCAQRCHWRWKLAERRKEWNREPEPRGVSRWKGKG